MKCLNCVMNIIPCQTFKIILITSSEIIKQSLMSYHFEHRSIKLKTELRSELNLELLISWTMNLLGRTGQKIQGQKC